MWEGENCEGLVNWLLGPISQLERKDYQVPKIWYIFNPESKSVTQGLSQDAMLWVGSPKLEAS